jgi:hypothetical protein
MQRVLRPVRLASPLLGLALAAAVASTGCTTVDPYTGEEKIDPLPTAAAVAGTAAAGALIWNATNDNDDDDHHHHGGRRGYRPFSPTPGVYCYPDQQRCYNEDGYAKKWTRRVFGD